jgi:hypothetical protein
MYLFYEAHIKRFFPKIKPTIAEININLQSVKIYVPV